MPVDLDRYKCLLFDFDGVIKESNDVKGIAFQQLFSDFGDEDFLTKILQFHKRNGGVSRAEKIRIFFNWLEVDVTPQMIADYSEKFSEIVVKKVVSCPFVEGVVDFLKNMESVKHLCVVSATPVLELVYICEKSEIHQYFNEIFGWPVSKRDAIRKVMNENFIRPSECVFFGDSVEDFNAALDTGIDFVYRRSEDIGLDRYSDLVVIRSFREI